MSHPPFPLHRFGFCSSQEMLDKVIHNVTSVLDGRNDLMEHAEQEGEGDEREEVDKNERKKYQVKTKPIMDAKIKILDILLTIADLRDNYRMLLLLQIFQKEFNEGYYSTTQKAKSAVKVSLREIQNILQSSENAVLELANLGSSLQQALMADDGESDVIKAMCDCCVPILCKFHTDSHPLLNKTQMTTQTRRTMTEGQVW
jgi:hypothetical protein